MKRQNQPSTPPPAELSTLQALGLLRDCLDEVCDAGERIIAAIEKFERKAEPFKDVSLSDKDVIQQLLTQLPPKKVSALVAALLGVAEFVPLAPIADREEQADQIKDDVRSLREIRNNFHDALDGLV